jgi:SAM-dependent methyltransferase
MNAAEIYEEKFATEVTYKYAHPLADIAEIKVGESVLDVACGTGVLTRVVANRTNLQAPVVGIDFDSNKLDVATKLAPGIKWVQGVAEKLEVPDCSFDHVVCQFGLMFFNRVTAITEMVRVLRPGGHLTVAVWESFDGYEELVKLIPQGAAAEVRQGFELSELHLLTSLFGAVNVSAPEVSRFERLACFPSIAEWLTAEVSTWSLDNQLNAVQVEDLARGDKFREFVSPRGTIALRNSAHIVKMTKTGDVNRTSATA